MGEKKIHKGFMFSATANSVADMVSADSKRIYSVDKKVNMDEYMTEKQLKKFDKYFKKCCDISRSAYIKWVEELIENKEIESEDKL